MSSVTQVRVENLSPAKLVGWVTGGRIRLPAFQRDYRWQPGDVESLFDSVLKRYPIGNLLLWERPADAARITIGPLVLDVPATPWAQWVVDGQQRITSLVGALAAPSGTTDPRFRVFMNLSTRRFRAASREPAGAGPWMPVSAAASNQSLVAWQRSRAELLDEAAYTASDDLAAALQEYPIPTYVVEADDERELRVVFDRMNNHGRPLRKEEIFDALHGVQGTGEPGDLGSVAATIAASGFGLMDDADVLRSLLALRGSDIFRDVRAEFDDDADRNEAFTRTEHVLLDVVGLIREEIGIPHVRVLPYPSANPLLVALVDRFGRPTGRAAELLRRWIWRAGAMGANPAGSPPQVRRALRTLAGCPDAESAARSLLRELPPQPRRWRPDLTQVAGNRALARVNMLGLVDLEPAELVPASRELAVPNPAISAGELLDAGGPVLHRLVRPRLIEDPELANSVANRLFHPPIDGDTVAAVLGTTPATRTSHGVDDRCATLLAENRWHEALEHRAALLRERIATTVADGAEWGARDEPTAAGLIGSVGC